MSTKNTEQEPRIGGSELSGKLERDFILWANENSPHPDLEDLLRAAYMSGARTERDECAYLCEAEGRGHRDGFGKHLAAMIRKRSNGKLTGGASAELGEKQ